MRLRGRYKLIIMLLLSAVLVMTMVPQTAFAETSLLGEFEENDGVITYEYDDETLLDTENSSESRKTAASSLPAEYSLVKKGFSSAVKDQDVYGTCWAFGAIASFESNLLMNGLCRDDIDLSERHLAYFTYSGKSPSSYQKSRFAGADRFVVLNEDESLYDQGGNRIYSGCTLERQYGAVDEAEAPYGANMGTLSPSLKKKSTYDIGDIYYLPEVNRDSGKRDKSAVIEMKKALMKYGAISIGCFAERDTYHFYNKQNDAAYCGDRKAANHEVTIVGWNDNFSRNSFGGRDGQKPESDGAWIIKNSWGKRENNKGYYYLSYYDKTYCEGTVFTAVNGAKNYYTAYQYDGTGYGDNFAYDDKLIRAANRYKARKDEKLGAYRIETPIAGTAVTVKIFKSTSSKKPNKGKLLYEGTKTFKYAGYNTLAFDKPLKISKGKYFTAIVTEKYKKNGKTEYIVPLEMEYNEKKVNRNKCIVDLASVKHGESFAYRNGKWYDVSYKSKLSNVFVKSFLNNKTIGNAVGKVLTVR